MIRFLDNTHLVTIEISSDHLTRKIMRSIAVYCINYFDGAMGRLIISNTDKQGIKHVVDYDIICNNDKYSKILLFLVTLTLLQFMK